MINRLLVWLGLRKPPLPQYIKYIDPDGAVQEVEFLNVGWKWYGGYGKTDE